MNILIVDDEPDLLMEMEHCVKNYGGAHSYIICNTPTEALAQAVDRSIDIALLDIEMPEMNGLELAERLTGLFPKVAVIFVTAYNYYAVQAFEVNALDYILKPVREERLFKALDRVMARRTRRSGADSKEGRLAITMFKRFSVRIGDQWIKWNRKKTVELLAYLLDNKDNAIHKETLCELFWPDFEHERALMNLQTTIYMIRKVFSKSQIGQIRIEFSRDSYSIHLKDVYCDVEEFERMLQKASRQNDPALWKQAINLYNGDYLEEEGWLWAEPRKVMLYRKYLAAVKKLKDTTNGTMEDVIR